MENTSLFAMVIRKNRVTVKLKQMAHSGLFLIRFKQFYWIKTVDVGTIWTWIVGINGELADHLTTTTVQEAKLQLCLQTYRLPKLFLYKKYVFSFIKPPADLAWLGIALNRRTCQKIVRSTYYLMVIAKLVWKWTFLHCSRCHKQILDQHSYIMLK